MQQLSSNSFGQARHCSRAYRARQTVFGWSYRDDSSSSFFPAHDFSETDYNQMLLCSPWQDDELIQLHCLIKMNT